MYHVPATEDIRKQSGVPFGLVLSPLARVQEGENEPPISDFGPTGPVRCMRCKGNYLSSTVRYCKMCIPLIVKVLLLKTLIIF